MTSATAMGSDSSITLSGLLQTGAGYREISGYLDGLPSDVRMAQVLGITGRSVKRLYKAVKDAPPVDVDDLFPPDTKRTIILEGRNSLPLFTRFQKRFCRLEGGAIVGYNHQVTAFAVGPGYFMVEPPATEGPFKGELLFDYTQRPPAEPAGWPPFLPNSRGLSKAVYMHMKDYCRQVARGVIVGTAYKKGVDQNAYFTLTRA